ncbi:hypothetical protein D3C86_2114500 [compost metagenome]
MGLFEAFFGQSDVCRAAVAVAVGVPESFSVAEQIHVKHGQWVMGTEPGMKPF